MPGASKNAGWYPLTSQSLQYNQSDSQSDRQSLQSNRQLVSASTHQCVIRLRVKTVPAAQQQHRNDWTRTMAHQVEREDLGKRNSQNYATE